MTVESFEQDPNGAGQDAGISDEGTQPAAQAAPAERTYTQRDYDRQFAEARRSFESQAKRDRDAAIAQARAEWQKSNAPKPDQSDPWSAFAPEVVQPLKTAFERMLEERTAPFKQELEKYTRVQEDLAFKNDEADLRARYKDYGPNRAAILEFAVRNNITNVDNAYHIWRSQTQWQDPEVVGKRYLADYQKKKATQSSQTPLAEGRGGGSPSTKTNFRGKDGKLDKDAMDEAALEIMRGASD